MFDQTRDHNLAAVRALLLAAFTTRTLPPFCRDHPHFRPLADEFDLSDGLDGMVDRVLAYCEARTLFPELLREVERFRTDPRTANAIPAATAPRQPRPLPDPDTLPYPGSLPSGSRLPFGRNALFTGRQEDLKALARALLHDEVAAVLVTQIVEGMGGIGKTQLAVEFAHRYGRFFGSVHWLHAGEPEALASEVAACGAVMELPGWPSQLPAQVDLTIQAWQAAGDPDQGPRLLILDGLEDVQAARAWLPRLRNPRQTGPGVCMLITARQRDWPGDLELVPLRLESFSPLESVAFLRQLLTADRVADADLEFLAERLGHLPLALALAGRRLARQRRLAVAAYLDAVERALDQPSMRAWGAVLGNPASVDYELARTFAATWGGEIPSVARRLFRMAGYCAPGQPVPWELLETAAGLEPGDCDRALELLAGLGLLEVESDLGPAIHPLLAQYARTSPPAPGEEAGREPPLPALAAALARLATVINDRIDRTGDRLLMAPLLPHLRPVARAAGERQLKDAGSVWVNLGYHLHRAADYDGARAAYKQALAIWERVLGTDHPDVAVVYNNLGGVLHDLGDLEGARAAYERALEIDDTVHGPEHPVVARDVHNLGGALRDLGDLAGARAAYERALRAWQAAYGEEQEQVAMAHSSLGGVLYDLGDLGGARAAYEQALAIDERNYGARHPDVATDLNNLGMVLKDLGDLEEAQAAFERALAIDEAAHGPEHPLVAVRLHNLGTVLEALGEYDPAQGAYGRALAIREQSLGEEDPQTASLLNDLGGLLLTQGQFAEARACLERALAIYEKVFGGSHPLVATTVNNLGMVLRDQGDLPSARAAFERALAIDERVYDSDHPDVARDVNNLGSVLYAMGDLAGARAAFERALAIDEAVFGPDHPDVARGVNNLGSVLQLLGDLEGARAAYERALAIDERTYGSQHPRIAIRVNNLGGVLKAMGNLQDARGAFSWALAILEKHLPPDHPNIQTVRRNLDSLKG